MRGRSNLTVKLQAHALHIVVDSGRAAGVELVASSSRTPSLARASCEVIVASGAIGSPRLLPHSGIGPADHLRGVGVKVVHDLPGVGANLQDHLDPFAIAECTGDHSYDKYNRPQHAAWALLQYLLFKNGPVASRTRPRLAARRGHGARPSAGPPRFLLVANYLGDVPLELPLPAPILARKQKALEGQREVGT